MISRQEVEESVRARFGSLAVEPGREMPFPVGPESAKALGYGQDVIDAMPRSATDTFAGVGNPLGLAPPEGGETILDLGSGAGLDSLLAARQVGPSGKVIGVDFTDDMVEKARRNARLVGAPNVEFLAGTADALPVGSVTVDRVITNGVFNLCFDKPAVVREIYRVLRPGGRLQMADILLEEHVSPEELARLGEWSA